MYKNIKNGNKPPVAFLLDAPGQPGFSFVQSPYHELLDIATHLDDRKELQNRVWRVAGYLMKHK